MAPDAGKTIGLELERHRGAVFARASIGGGAFVQTEQVLHVMAQSVRDDVGRGKIAWRAEALGQRGEEPQIQVHLAIRWAVERSGRRLREAASRIDGIAK